MNSKKHLENLHYELDKAMFRCNLAFDMMKSFDPNYQLKDFRGNLATIQHLLGNSKDRIERQLRRINNVKTKKVSIKRG